MANLNWSPVERSGKIPFRETLFQQFVGKRNVDLYITLPGEQLECVNYGFANRCFHPKVKVRGAEINKPEHLIIQNAIAKQYAGHDMNIRWGDIAELPIENVPANNGLAYMDYKGNPNADNAYYIKHKLPQNFASSFCVGITFDENLRGPLNSFIPTIERLFNDKWKDFLSKFEQHAAQTHVGDIRLCAVFSMLTRFYLFPFWQYDYNYELIDGKSEPGSPHTMCLLYIPQLKRSDKEKYLNLNDPSTQRVLFLADEIDVIVRGKKRGMSIAQACNQCRIMLFDRDFKKTAVIRRLYEYMYGYNPPANREEEAERVFSLLLASALLGLESEKTLQRGGSEGQGHIRQGMGWTILRRSITTSRKMQPLRALKMATANMDYTVDQFLDRFGYLIDNDPHKAYGYLKLAKAESSKPSKRLIATL